METALQACPPIVEHKTHHNVCDTLCGVGEKKPRRRGLQLIKRTTAEQEVEAGFSQRNKQKKKKQKKKMWKEEDAAADDDGDVDEQENVLSLGQQGVQEDIVRVHTLVASLKVCGKLKDLNRGRRIHAYIDKVGLLEKDVFLGSSLVNMYAKCGLLEKAQEVFDKLSVRNVVSWNAVISGYAQLGHGYQALQCFERMRSEGLSPNTVTYTCVLNACGSIEAAEKGKEIHAEILRKGLLKKDIVVGNALVDMYTKCGLLAKAQEVFDMLPVRDVISWSALIVGYAQHGHGKKALECFEQMQLDGLCPNAVTYTCILKACCSLGAADKGKELHAKILKEGLMENNIVLGNTLVDMYIKCGLLDKAQEVFDELPSRDVVSWSSLIAGYAQHGHAKLAMECFDQMQHEGLCPNAVTYICILKACGSLGAVDKGQEIHAGIIREGFLEHDIVVGTALVDMYAKCGLLAEAQEVFNKLSQQNLVSWNALIAGYTQHGHGEKALRCYEWMQLEGLSPDVITFICVLKACGSVGAADKGKEIHAKIARNGLLKNDVAVGIGLVDMYAKCGLLARAQEVFDNLPVHDVVSWSALMAGYALLGKNEHVFNLFNEMIGKGIAPDMITFTIVINACSHTGLLDKGQMYFETMRTRYNILPNLELYTCIVDLFARAGYLDKAVAVIKEMPFSADLTVWLTVLGACRKWKNLKLGRLAFEHAVQLDEKEASAYVCMSNIFADVGRQKDADKIKALRVKNQAQKKPEVCRWTKASGYVHLFSDGG